MKEKACEKCILSKRENWDRDVDCTVPYDYETYNVLKLHNPGSRKTLLINERLVLVSEKVLKSLENNWKSLGWSQIYKVSK